MGSEVTNGATLSLSYKLIQTLEKVQEERDALQVVCRELLALCRASGAPINQDKLGLYESLLKK